MSDLMALKPRQCDAPPIQTSNINWLQTTISTPIVCAGIAVHKGTPSRIVMRPAPADTGIVFRNANGGGKGTIKAIANHVTELQLGTTLSDGNGFSVGVVEHFMAACYGMGLDNVFVDIVGNELPIMDGSSEEFCALIASSGLEKLRKPKRAIRILKSIEVRDGARWARLDPTETEYLRLSARISFDTSAIGTQTFDLLLSDGAFREELAFARTFGFADGLEKLKKQGLARGGSLDNAICIDGDHIMNPEGLRTHDEFIRHKILDAVGDLALLGSPIFGHYCAEQPGHALNNALACKTLASPDSWCWETPGSSGLSSAMISEKRHALI